MQEVAAERGIRQARRQEKSEMLRALLVKIQRRLSRREFFPAVSRSLCVMC